MELGSKERSSIMMVADSKKREGYGMKSDILSRGNNMSKDIDAQMYISQSVSQFSLVRLFATPWTSAHQASLSITNSRSPPKPMSVESVMPCNHLIFVYSMFQNLQVLLNGYHVRGIGWQEMDWGQIT